MVRRVQRVQQGVVGTAGCGGYNRYGMVWTLPQVQRETAFAPARARTRFISERTGESVPAHQ